MESKFYTAPVPPDEFLRKLENKIKSSQELNFFERQVNYINYNHIQIKNNQLILEKKGMPFESRNSPYRGYSGTIKATFEEDQSRTKFTVQFYPQTSLGDFMHVAFSIAISLTAIAYLIFNFSWPALFFSLLGFGIIQAIFVVTKFEYLRNFEIYFNDFIAEVLKHRS